MIYRHLSAVAIMATFLFFACASDTKKAATLSEPSKERTANDDKADSLLLKYDPAKGDQWIADFVDNLHRKYGFNGNMLVAK
ncbi:MAG: serine hydrolase, partial [Bacteroidota bacterium]